MYIVTGLGRSGTSLVAEIIHRYGIYMGEYISNVDAGYENPSIAHVNKMIMNGDFWGDDRTVRTMLGLSLETVIAKDPRFIITLGLWLRYKTKIDGIFFCKRDLRDTLGSSERTNAGTMAIFNGFTEDHKMEIAGSIVRGFLSLCSSASVPVFAIEFPESIGDFEQIRCLDRVLPDHERLFAAWKNTVRPSRSQTARKRSGEKSPEIMKEDWKQGTAPDEDVKPGEEVCAHEESFVPELVSIVIPVFNKLPYTQKCLQAVRQNTPCDLYELIIIDNASTDDTREFLASIGDKVRVIENTVNRGFTAACNQGARIARGEYVLFLNNDTEPQPGWLENMTELFDSDNLIGIVGSKLVYPDGRLQEAGGIVFSDGSGWNFGRFDDRRKPVYSYMREVDYVSGASLMVKHALLRRLNYFDEQYSPGYYEDTDLCFGARSLGYKVMYSPFSVVVHHEGVSGGTDLHRGMKKYQVINKEKFSLKWKAALAGQHSPGGRNVTAASERNVKRNILIIDPFLPLFDRASGGLRLFTIIQILKSLSCHITYVARDGRGQETYVRSLRKMGVEVYATDPEKLGQLGLKADADKIDLRTILSGRYYDTAILSFYDVADQYLEEIRRFSPETKIVIDTVDIHFIREMRMAGAEKNRKLMKKAEQTRKKELSAYRKADAVVTVTEKDWEQIMEELPDKQHFVIPNIHAVDDSPPVPDGREGMVFVGNFNHPPNADAVKYFVKEIFPLVKQRIPGIGFTIVGNNPPEEILAFRSKSITVTGYVPSTEPYLKSARVSVAPLRYGAGMKGKIGEAMACGLPVVTTSMGSEGMGLVPDETALIADAPHEFAERIVRLCTDDAFWQKIARNGRDFIREHYSKDGVGRQLQCMIEALSPSEHPGLVDVSCNVGKDPVKGLTSIVVLTFNELEYTKQCVESVMKRTPERHEIIFVDNGSSDGTVKWLKELTQKHPDYKLIGNPTNLGFAKGCNQGMQMSSGEYILLLNNDAVVTEGWLSGMLECLESGPETGIVGPMTNYISGVQKDLFADYGSIDHLGKYAGNFRERNRYRRVPVRRVAGFCMLFRRSLIGKIGALDESFGSGNYEDDDFCLRSVLEGHRNLIAGDVFIHHYGNRSFVGNGIDYSSAMLGNRKIFSKKWSCIDVDGRLAKDLMAANAVENACNFRQKGMVHEAVEEFLKGIKYSPLDGNIYFSLAEMLIDEKRFKDASDLLERMPSAGNRSKRAALNGYCKEGMELYDEAGQYADIALSLEKNNPSAFNLKGVLAYKYGERAEAERLFSEAIKCDPSFGEPYTNLGVLRWAAGLKEEAVPLAEKGFVLYPYINDIATIYHSMITALEDYERGEKRFREAKSLCPLNRKIAFFLVDILIRQGKNEEAIEDIEDAMLVFGMDDGIISAALKVREKAGPKEIKKQGSRIQGFKGSSGEAETLPSKSRFSDSISLCMIVKNEEKYLARCLWSVRDLVGEMIVVDTGSGDRTKDIARIFGAKVYDFGWTNDFSEARNFSLSKASGDWIMVLDADEVISPEDHDALALIMRRKSGKTAAYSLVTRNYVRDMAVTGWTPNDGRYAEEAGSGWFPSEKVRLFRNDRRIRFDNPVHELVEFSLARARIKVKKCSVPVHHYGKMDSEKVLSKGEDYYLLGKKKLEEKAGDLQALFELAVQATELKRYDDAVELWQMVIDFRGGVPPESLSRAYLNIGAVHLERGRYEEALLSSRKAMDLNPHMKGAAMNYALSELCAGDIQNVIPVLEGLLQAEPEYLPALRMLFAVLCIDGRSQQRRDCLEKIKRAGADCSACCHHYARHLVSAGRAEQAMVLLNAAIESDNSNEDILNLLSECCGMYDRGQCTVESKSEAAQAHFNLARACRERGDLDKAAAGFLKAVNIKQDYAEAYNYLGNTVTLQGRLEAAEACYREAININSGYVEAFYNLGNVLCLMKRHEEAVRSYQKAIGLMPDFPEAYYKLGQSLCSLGRHDEAVMNYERALELNPEFAEAYNAIGNALRESGKPEEAIGSYGEALKLNPDFAEVYYNISNICLDAGDVEGALQNCRRSLAINPDLPDAHWNMALALLTKGDLKPGWANYGWRFLKKDAPPVPFKYPSWDGSYLRGKTLLVYAEQGVGDEIMFASCLPDVLSRVDACVLECDARLVPLFSRSFPEVRTIGRVKTKDDNAPEGLPPVDVQIAIGSLPEFFRASVGGFPDRQAYLVPDCRKAEGWRDRFKSLGAGLKIGISWRGGRELCVKKMRSTVLDQWSGLFSVPGVSFINLQYGDSKEELRRVREETGARIYDWEDADPLMDLDNFAAQIAALDLVISVDNSTVHMAGALGVPVWTMLPLGCDWRWMTRYEDTPWYPFMRLFRQKYPGDWESVFADVVKRLQEIASAGAVFPIESALSYRSFHCRDMSGSMILSG